jgi:D-glutamate cyclase
MTYQSCILPCEAIDLLMSVEIRPWSRPKGYMRGYYEAARTSKNPISYDITSDILGLGHARVAIVTGIYSPQHFPVGEVDGPTGGAVLARALEMLGHEVHFLAEDQIRGPFEGLKHRLRLNAAFRSTSGLSREIVRGWADEYDIAVAIEKLGRAADGRRYSIQGTPMDIDGDSYIDDMFLAMNENGKLTIGIGDGGNEIGHGRIYDTVVALHPKGAVVATVTPAKYVYPVSVSNFGAYALCAALALQTGRPELMVEGATVRTLITTVTTLGQLDGSTVDPHYIGDDGVPIDAVCRIVELLRDIVGHWGRTIVRQF